MKKITLELEQSVYDKAKEEVRKEYKWYHFSNMIFPIMICIFLVIYYFILSPSKFEQGKVMCEYLITTEKGTQFIEMNSNPTAEEFIAKVGLVKVLETRQLACEDER